MIRFAIIGCGSIAHRHAEHIHRLGTLIGVCDVIAEKAKVLGEHYQVPYFSSPETMIESVNDADVISICSPNGLHAQHSILALNAGFHVLCEKPMAISSKDCSEMMQVAKVSGRLLFAIKQNRFNPPVVALKNAIDTGKLGRILSVQLNCFWNRNDDYYKDSWKGSADMDGGTLFTQFSHFVDLLYWMIGDVDEVAAFTDNYIHKGVIEFEDSGVVILRFLNGAIASINYTVNAHDKNMEGSITVFGEKGTVKIGGQYLNELEYQSIENFVIDNLPPGNRPNFYGSYVGSMSNHDKVYANVIDVLQNGASINVSAFEAMKTVEIIEKIYSAARSKF